MSIIKDRTSNAVIDDLGNIYPSIRNLAKKIHMKRDNLSRNLIDGGFERDGRFYKLYDDKSENNAVNLEDKETIIKRQLEEDPDYQEYLEHKNVRDINFQVYDVTFTHHKNGSRYAIALFSDAHIEETVRPDAVMGMNEYNINIAEKRITTYFANLASCLNEDRVEDLIFGCLGDIISGYIHDELSQTNGLSPLEAIYKAQSLLFSGLQFLCRNTSLRSITFVGIVGNHSRTTKRIQHSNGYKMSYEWLMYQNLKDKCQDVGLPITFNIPDSEMAIIRTEDGKKYIFVHGFQIKAGGTNTVCGIYPALNRLTMRWNRSFDQDKVFLGHFHSCVSIPNAVVNGSIIGYNAFALTNGFVYEEPAQMYEVHDTEMGELLTRKIYCK